jgi:hypothetical protein
VPVRIRPRARQIPMGGLMDAKSLNPSMNEKQEEAGPEKAEL